MILHKTENKNNGLKLAYDIIFLTEMEEEKLWSILNGMDSLLRINISKCKIRDKRQYNVESQ